MRKWFKPFIILGASWMTAGAATAQDTGAIASGGWDNPSTWTGGTVPGSANNVFIGSTYPTGAAATATVTISTLDEKANNLYLGYGSGNSGTLDLVGHKLTVTGDISIGLAVSGGTTGGIGVINESSGGSFQAASVQVRSGNSLTFGANDVASGLLVAGGSTVTTTATGNVTSGVAMAGAGVLNLGADMTLTMTTAGTGQLTATGTGTTINMNGHALNAYARRPPASSTSRTAARSSTPRATRSRPTVSSSGRTAHRR